MRTTVNFQYRYGMSTMEALKHLYNDGGRGLGGIRRFYRGLGPALFQGPLSRFGDTAANAGMMALWDANPNTADLPAAVKTVAASAAAAGFRVFLMPIDACKTILQVEGATGMQKLGAKMKKGGPQVLWAGAMGSMTATFIGHYPWFFTYNFLNASLPIYDRKTELPSYLARNALIGFCSSAISDTCSNSVRVMKTTIQTSTEPITYRKAFAMIVEKDGLSGLFFRGAPTTSPPPRPTTARPAPEPGAPERVAAHARRLLYRPPQPTHGTPLLPRVPSAPQAWAPRSSRTASRASSSPCCGGWGRTTSTQRSERRARPAAMRRRTDRSRGHAHTAACSQALAMRAPGAGREAASAHSARGQHTNKTVNTAGETARRTERAPRAPLSQPLRSKGRALRARGLFIGAWPQGTGSLAVTRSLDTISSRHRSRSTTPTQHARRPGAPRAT